MVFDGWVFGIRYPRCLGILANIRQSRHFVFRSDFCRGDERFELLVFGQIGARDVSRPAD